ncbi:MAG: phenylacetate-CoA oxygenase subunit PaaJ [Saprospiraceae bacterium]|nr:phenylacetate-CoA oxygenase subunit PaaJ [Saprospiraceae bacterium]
MRTRIYEILENVCDPEVPVLSILDLGIVRDVLVEKEGVEVVITPTYSGCPAMNMIAMNIRIELAAVGFPNVKISEVLKPAWTTDWLTENGKRKLKEYGIAPPQYSSKKMRENLDFGVENAIPCPLCDSLNTELISEFGSTSCKSLHRCKDCLEPFDYFKCH